MKNKRLGEMLVDAGILSEKQIEEAIALQKFRQKIRYNFIRKSLY